MMSKSMTANVNKDKLSKGKLVENKESAALFDAYQKKRDPFNGHRPRLEIYGKVPSARHGFFTTKLEGKVQSDTSLGWQKAPLDIAYTVAGTKGPVWVFLHGVPMNRRMKFELMRRMSPFCRCVAFDMLGMGESSMPLDFAWNWETHATYVPGLIEYVLEKEFKMSKNTKVFFQTDDWGSGIGAKVMETKWAQKHLHAKIFLDPIAFSGYFIAEIGTMGRVSQLPWQPNPSGDAKIAKQNMTFEMAVGALDQSLAQIEKSMVRDNKVTNQWQQRDDLHPYVETDYERNRSSSVRGTAVDRLRSLMSITTQHVYTPLTRRLKMWHIRVFCQQSAYLRPAALQPYHKQKNPQGIQYNKVKLPVFIQWGREDNMMPANQVYHFKYALKNAPCRISSIPDAGHFAEKDQPDLIATEYLNYTEEMLGLSSLAQPFLGFTGIWKGEEEERATALKQMYFK